MNDCIFCKIISGEIPTNTVHETDTSISFLSIAPVNPGHLLIVPKLHYQWMYELPDELLSKLMQQAKNIMPRLKQVTGADFVNLVVEGVEVPHFHIHLIPRYLGDRKIEAHPTVYKGNEAREWAEKIKSAIEAL